MKKIKIIIAIVTLVISSNLNSQVRVGGSIDININFPAPKVIIVKEAPKPVYKTKKVKKHNSKCERRDNNLGSIRNQNNRYGSIDLLVIDVSFENIGNGLERITYFTNTRETLEVILRTNNPNDYNYHYHTNPHCNSNSIVAVALNGYEMPLQNGSIALQSGQQFHTVLNLHSYHQGNFNGVVSF